jgi:predicted AlkP superfamily phosphohydrolase/phosphomutase
LKTKLEALIDTDGTRVVLSAPLATDIYDGDRLAEAPDILVGYNQGYGNSDEAAQGQITAEVLIDNDRSGTFNGSHLMDPSVVGGILITNRGLALDDPELIDITATILKRYGVDPDESMRGRPVLR